MLARHARIAAIQNRKFCDLHHSVGVPLLRKKTQYLSNGEALISVINWTSWVAIAARIAEERLFAGCKSFRGWNIVMAFEWLRSARLACNKLQWLLKGHEQHVLQKSRTPK